MHNNNAKQTLTGRPFYHHSCTLAKMLAQVQQACASAAANDTPIYNYAELPILQCSNAPITFLLVLPLCFQHSAGGAIVAVVVVASGCMRPDKSEPSRFLTTHQPHQCPNYCYSTFNVSNKNRHADTDFTKAVGQPGKGS